MGSYNYNSYAALSGLAAGAMVFFIIMLIIVLVIAVLKIIGLWKIFTKAGQPGWGALIPIYSDYLLCKTVGINPLWIVIVLCSPILAILPLGSLVTTAISIYYMILINVSLARSFEKDDAYAVGLIFLSPVFYLMLGLSDAKYVGEKPMNDIIFKK